MILFKTHITSLPTLPIYLRLNKTQQYSTLVQLFVAFILDLFLLGGLYWIIFTGDGEIRILYRPTKCAVFFSFRMCIFPYNRPEIDIVTIVYTN